MPWAVGIDEAGYGPNLGPFVQAAVAADVGTGWGHCRRTGLSGPLPIIDDSKKLYTAAGFAGLEAAVFAACGFEAGSYARFLERLGFENRVREMLAEPWCEPDEQMPSRDAAANPLPGLHRVWLNAVPAAGFNALVGPTNKGAAPAEGVQRFLRAAVAELPGDDRIDAVCDKLGGRNFYAAILADAFPDGWVVADRESAAESSYRVLNLPRVLTVTFRPKADATSVPVALASMVAKYVREVAMGQFNRFWAARVPDLVWTAGYPLDANRFYAEIRAAMEAEGIPDDAVWRIK